jgi:hypothetical protein
LSFRHFFAADAFAFTGFASFYFARRSISLRISLLFSFGRSSITIADTFRYFFFLLIIKASCISFRFYAFFSFSGIFFAFLRQLSFFRLFASAFIFAIFFEIFSRFFDISLMILILFSITLIISRFARLIDFFDGLHFLLRLQFFFFELLQAPFFAAFFSRFRASDTPSSSPVISSMPML